MKASRIWAFIISLVICLSVTAPAYADASQTKVTVKKGDTVYGICQSLGLDYNICKNTIMRLNGMEKESELSSIKVGSTLIFPASSKDCAGEQAAYAEGFLAHLLDDEFLAAYPDI